MPSSFSFKDWYEENGIALNKSRRDRYKTDPEYRAKVLAANRESREKVRKEKQAERKLENEAVQVRVNPTPWKQVDGSVKGKDVRLFTVGALAHAVGKSVQMIRIWEKQGVIPATKLRNGKGDRLYTVEQVEKIYELLKKKGRLDENAVRRRYMPKSYRRLVEFSDGRRRVLRMFRVGVLATAVNRTIVTIEQMERNGIFPVTPFRYSQTGYRLYTVRMIRSVVEAMKHLEVSDREVAVKAFREAVVSDWTALGVMGAKIVKENPNGRVETDN